LNRAIRKAIKKRKLFPTDDSARTVIYLATQDSIKKMLHANYKLENSTQSVYDLIL